MDQVVEETVAEAVEALQDPYHFDSRISRVAVVGGGPSGVIIEKKKKTSMRNTLLLTFFNFLLHLVGSCKVAFATRFRNSAF